MNKPVVATRYGSLRGVDDDGVLTFLGVPYASAPVGPARFTPPTPPEQWSGVADATSAGAIAPQPESLIGGYVPGDPRTQDEACLSLNIFTPSLDGRRPVMVFLHGGAFLIGTGASVMYRSQGLARRGVVVVTLNYRLGALGFLAHRALRHGPSGVWANWGLLDQVAALAFVSDHAAAFGGDASNVTLFGESAGAMSAADLLAVPQAGGLFRRVALESGTCIAMSEATASTNAERLVGALGMDVVDVERLRQVPVEELLAAQKTLLGDLGVGASMPFQPVVDGDVLPRHPDAVIAEGASPAEAMLLGTNRDEFRFFTVGQRRLDTIDDEELARLVSAYLPRSSPLTAREVIRRYREVPGEHTSPRRLFEQIAADSIFWGPTMRVATAMTEVVPTFVYRFDWESPFLHGALGACHGLELPFVFGTVTNPLIGLFSGSGPEAEALADRVQGAWVAFATTGDPSTPVHPWPTFGSAQETFVFGREPSVVSAPRSQVASLWSEILGQYGERVAEEAPGT